MKAKAEHTLPAFHHAIAAKSSIEELCELICKELGYEQKITPWDKRYETVKFLHQKKLKDFFLIEDKYGNRAVKCAVQVEYPFLLDLVKLDLPDQDNPDFGSSWLSFIDPALCGVTRTQEIIQHILLEHREDLNKLSALLFKKDQWGRRPIYYMTAANLKYALTLLGFDPSVSDSEANGLSSTPDSLRYSMAREIYSRLDQLKTARDLKKWDKANEVSFSAEQVRRLVDFDKFVKSLPKARTDLIDNVLEKIMDAIDPDFVSPLIPPNAMYYAKPIDEEGRAILSEEDKAYYQQLNAARAKHLQANRDKENFSDALNAVFKKRCGYRKSIIQYAAAVGSPYLKDLCMLDLPQPGNAYSGTSWLILVDPSKCKFSKTEQVIKNILAEHSSDLRRFHALLFTADKNGRCPIHYMHPQLIGYVAELLNIQGAYKDSIRLQLITATIAERLALSSNSIETAGKTSTVLRFTASLGEIQQAIELKRQDLDKMQDLITELRLAASAGEIQQAIELKRQALDKTQRLIDRITNAFAKTNRTAKALLVFKEKFLAEILEASEKNLIDQAMGEQLIDKIVNFSYSESAQPPSPSFFNRAAEKSTVGKMVRFPDPDISSPSP